ncbi:conserved hypothetical protein [Trichinella spiralis]|uniref:hypothetical protein n=1 Tax=Trichinella spiralis TaxID=6334 RepID=UPI0001EFE091|nr:conserved hypothetical protein [Trichinella spiralis]
MGILCKHVAELNSLKINLNNKRQYSLVFKYPVECGREQIRLLAIQQNSGTQVLLLVFFTLTMHVKKAQILLLFSSYGLFPCHAANSPVAPGCNSCEQCSAIETTGQ